MAEKDLINIHSVIPLSRVNGPGARMVVFFQGCARRCPGCFNPRTHPIETVSLYSPEELFEEHLAAGIEGITVSGGEPFLQPRGLLLLLKAAREEYGLTTVVYTGFDYGELRARQNLSCVLDHVDVLVDGAFDRTRKEPTLLARGSTNQRFHFLNGTYRIEDFYMPGKAEIIIREDGTVVETGFSRIDGSAA